MKQLIWVGSTLKDVRKFSQDVQDVVVSALDEAKEGGKHQDAKPLKGFTGAGVLEVVDDYDGDTYRAVYTVRLSEAVYVLHAFKKKSTKGIKTPKRDIDLIKTRLKLSVRSFSTVIAQLKGRAMPDRAFVGAKASFESRPSSRQRCAATLHVD